MKAKYGVFSVTKNGEVDGRSDELPEGCVYNKLEDAIEAQQYLLSKEPQMFKEWKVFDVREHRDYAKETKEAVADWIRNYVSNIFIYEVEFHNIPFLDDAVDFLEHIDIHGLLEIER